MSGIRRGLMMAQQKIENPYDFNGTDQYLDTGIKLWTGQPFTLMLVFTSRAVDNGANQTIFTTRNHGSEHGVTFSQLTGSAFERCSMIGKSGYTPITVFDDSVYGVRRGLVLTFDGNRVTYSEIVTSKDAYPYRTLSSISLPSSHTDETLLLGANRIASGIGEFWNGKINAMRIDNRELGANEKYNFFIAQGL